MEARASALTASSISRPSWLRGSVILSTSALAVYARMQSTMSALVHSSPALVQCASYAVRLPDKRHSVLKAHAMLCAGSAGQDAVHHVCARPQLSCTRAVQMFDRTRPVSKAHVTQRRRSCWLHSMLWTLGFMAIVIADPISMSAVIQSSPLLLQSLTMHAQSTRHMSINVTGHADWTACCGPLQLWLF